MESSNEVVLNWIPEVDASGEDTDADMLDLVDISESEAEDDGYLDDLGGKTIVDDEGRRTHRVICSHGAVIQLHVRELQKTEDVLLQDFCPML